MQQNGELSVEEILESIKKVIARDNKEGAQVERHRRETEGVVLRGPGATFGLTPMVPTGNDDDLDDTNLDDSQEDSEVLDLGSAATELLSDSADAEESDALSRVTDAEPLSPPEVHAEINLPMAQEPLRSETPEEPADQSTEGLAAMTDDTAYDDMPASETETPLERMVRESLRPMLREWLDANLPPIVERMVKSELERIMGKLS